MCRACLVLALTLFVVYIVPGLVYTAHRIAVAFISQPERARKERADLIVRLQQAELGVQQRIDAQQVLFNTLVDYYNEVRSEANIDPDAVALTKSYCDETLKELSGLRVSLEEYKNLRTRIDQIEFNPTFSSRLICAVYEGLGSKR